MRGRLGPRGLTLLELMVALATVAVLAAIAVPGYRGYVLRAQRTDAMTALLRIQAAQERFFLQHHRYAGELSAPPPFGLGIPALSERGLYVLTLEAGAAAAPAFTARASPRPGSGQTEDTPCALFSIDQNGTREASDRTGARRTKECWR